MKLSLLLTLIIGICTGCAGNAPRASVPVIDQELAIISGHTHQIRALGLGKSIELQDDFVQGLLDGGRENACDIQDGQPIMCVLALSGGGGSGAYGAGVLTGWTETGERPEFKIVTGVSTGALIAPFAFLGSAYDPELELAFTTIEGESDVVTRRPLVTLLTAESIALAQPLIERINDSIDEETVAALAAEHRKGRRLYIGTTNLDAERFTVWNIGAIALSGDGDLIRKVILASASIPGVMPPVLFDVAVDDVRYDEMHVDGGIQSQFFLPIDVIDLDAAMASAMARGFQGQPKPRLYIIRNARFTPEAGFAERRLGPILRRSVSSMIQSMGRLDLAQIFAFSKARGSDLFYTEVPDDFVWGSDDEFNGPEMRRLYQRGREVIQEPSPWRTTPAGLFPKNARFEEPLTQG